MPLRLERRPRPSRAMSWASPLIAAALTAGLAMILFALDGRAPVSTLWIFLSTPLADLYGFGELLLKAAPLILIGVGLAIGFRAGVWNIGAEGQLVLGVIFGGWLALEFGGAGPWVMPAMLLLGGVGGALWAAIPALLKTRFNASEILTSLMLNYCAQLWLAYLVFGPWRDPAGFNFPQSAPLHPDALLPIVIENTRANIEIVLAVLAALVAWIFIERTHLGFQLRVTGAAPGAARYAGFPVRRAVWIGMLTGGFAAGVAGVGEIAGPLGQIFPTASAGYGYAAIIVAFLGRLHPAGIVASGLLLALLAIAGDYAQMMLGMPSSIGGLFQGTLLFFLLAADVLTTWRIRRVDETAPLSAPEAA